MIDGATCVSHARFCAFIRAGKGTHMQASSATNTPTPAGCFVQRSPTRGRGGGSRRAAKDASTSTSTSTSRKGRTLAVTTRCYGEPGSSNDGNKSPSIQLRGSAARLEVMRAKPLFTIGLFADAQVRTQRAQDERDVIPERSLYTTQHTTPSSRHSFAPFPSA